ncbi:hypothetical protein ACR6C2_13870 [Streptomyces sp. INA 01156]
MTVGESSWGGPCCAWPASLPPPPSTPSRPRTHRSPRGEATPSGTYAVDCQEIADRIVQARAERERWEALDPSATPANPRLVITDRAVPKECVDELKGRDLKDR